jgi:hypothetical protein
MPRQILPSSAILCPLIVQTAGNRRASPSLDLEISEEPSDMRASPPRLHDDHTPPCAPMFYSLEAIYTMIYLGATLLMN